jgi:hypothetical protein
MKDILEKHDFHVNRIEELFFIEWNMASFKRKLAGLIKKFLSWRGIGTYGIHRNIYFEALKR